MIKKALDWDALANSVNSGTTTYSGKYFKLTTDIDNPVTTMVGNSEQNAFQGFFIGNGKKLIVNYVTEEQYTAPFRYIDGATITGLTVDGIIQASAKFAGGLVGFAKGSNLISGCRSSVAIWSEVTMSASGSKTFVRYNESYVAALGDGWQQSGQNGAAVPIMDCNNIGSAIVTGLNKRYLYQNDNAIDIDYTVTATDGKVLTKGTDYTAEITLGDYETVSSVTAIGFYTLTLTGKDPYSGKKTLTFYVYDTIDLSTITENYEVLNGETLTGKLGSKVKITIADGADYNLIGWVAENAGTTKFYPTGTKYCDLVVEPKTTVTLYAQWMKGDGSADAPYEIDGEVQWLTMADHINNGDGTYNSLHYKLTADISVTETVKDGATPASMIGTSESNAFKGTFDGNGHTITLNITDNSSDDYCAPFRYLKDGTVKNLHVTGTITKADKNNAVNNATATDGCVTFTGTYAPVSIGDTGDNTKLYLGSGNKLYYPHAAMHINAFRSYFQLADGLTAGDPTTGARVLAFKLNFGDNDGDTAGIVSMSDVRSKMSDVWFDLSGRRLSSKPTQRGVYINGGIKVVIK